MKRLSLFLGLFLFSIGTMLAQRTVTGTVVDNTGEGLIGANILAKGTTTGTITDLDGSFSISVPDGTNVLIFSFTGYESQEIDVTGQSNVAITLSEGELLDEVVVTALGIKKSEKSVGYAVQQVTSDEIKRSGATNAVEALRGKAAGVNMVKSSGAAGAGTNILIRGQTSLTGNNQALMVVDGVKINNSTLYSGGTGDTQGRTAGTAQSSRGMDINPNDIESINILKGAAATALYGVDGARGVIVITTKRGATGDKKVQVDVGTRLALDKISKTPDLQGTYAQGNNGEYREFFSRSWGPRISDLRYDGATDYPYNPNGRIVLASDPSATSQAANVYDNIENFFQTGVTKENNLAISGGSEKSNFRLSMSALNQEGIVPLNTYDRYTFQLSSDLQITDKLDIAGTFNYVLSENRKVQQGSNTSGLMLGLLRTPVSFDNSNGVSDPVNNTGSYVLPTGGQRNYAGGGLFDNPFWTINNAPGFDNVNRFFGSIRANYRFHPWANLSLNVGTDTWSDNRRQEFEIGTRTNAGGAVIEDQYFFRNIDAYLNLSGGGDLTGDIGMEYLLGVNAYDEQRNQLFTRGDGLSFPGFVHVTNAATVQSDNNDRNLRNIGFYGSVSFDYKKMLYLTGTGRTDFVSTLIDPNNFDAGAISFFYPSVNMGFVFSELLENDDFLSFGKLRMSWAKVGGGAPNPYGTSTTYNNSTFGDGWTNGITFPFNGVSGFTLANQLGNNKLLPETSRTYEIGGDLRFFNNKIGIDVTYYNRETKDQILPVTLAASSGYTTALLNTGLLSASGWEVVLNLTPVETRNFSWNSTINFDRNQTLVKRLVGDLDGNGEDDVKTLIIGGFTRSGIYHVVGQPFGVLFGGSFVREGTGGPNDNGVAQPEGQIVINDDPTSNEYGYGLSDNALRVFGNPNPDFTVGFNNRFNFKDVTLSFLIDWRSGGDLWNGTNWALTNYGSAQITADTREETPAPLDGVLSDGSPNNIPIVRDRSYWQSSNGGFGDIREHFVEDGGYVRLREVSLSFNLNPKWFSEKFFSSGSFTLNGQNLWYTTGYTGVDPDTNLTGVGNAQGFDYFNMPGTRTYSAALNLTF